MGTSITDLFRSETEFDVKASEMYAVIREAVKSELLLNAVNCGVPHNFIREMATGKKEGTEIKIDLPYCGMFPPDAKEREKIRKLFGLPPSEEHPEQTIGKCDENGKITEINSVSVDGDRENDVPAAGHTIGSGSVGILRTYEQRVEWMDIQDIIRKGHAGASIPPGTEIKFTLKNGDAAAVVIVATDHYKKGDCVFWFRQIVGKHCMNEENTNAGGFRDSDMKEYLDEVFDLLPDELQSVISLHKTVQKIGEETIETESRLFLMSMHEGRGANDWAEYNGTDKQFPFFEERRNRVAYDADGDPCWYWTADPSAANTTHFCNFTNSGHSSFSGASNDGGVAPLFVIE